MLSCPANQPLVFCYWGKIRISWKDIKPCLEQSSGWRTRSTAPWRARYLLWVFRASIWNLLNVTGLSSAGQRAMSASLSRASLSLWSSFDMIRSPLILSRLMVNLSSKLGIQTSPLDWSDIIRDNFGSLCWVWLGLVTLLEHPPTKSLLDCRLIMPVLRSLLDCLLMTPLKSLLDVLLVIFLAGTGTLTDILFWPC